MAMRNRSDRLAARAEEAADISLGSAQIALKAAKSIPAPAARGGGGLLLHE